MPNKVGQVAKSFLDCMKRNKPKILTGIGIVGSIGAVVTAVAVTPKAIKKLDRAKDKKDTDKLSVKEVVKETWTCYIPVVAVETIAVSCIIGGSAESARRNAALAAAYSMSETAFRTYKDKVVETIGEKKEKAIRDEIAADEVKNFDANPQAVIQTGHGNTLCYDPLSARCYESDIEFLKKTVNNLNREMRSSNTINLNEFYMAIDLPCVDSVIGDELGWNIDTGYIDIDVSYHVMLDGRRVAVINHIQPPKYGYNDW